MNLDNAKSEKITDDVTTSSFTVKIEPNFEEAESSLSIKEEIESASEGQENNGDIQNHVYFSVKEEVSIGVDAQAEHFERNTDSNDGTSLKHDITERRDVKIENYYATFPDSYSCTEYDESSLAVKSENEIEDTNKTNLEQCGLYLKSEADEAVTEMHLISNKVFNTTSKITHPEDGFIESQTTKTLVMEILPVSHVDNLNYNSLNPEEILPTVRSNIDKEINFKGSYQLNSITGNVLSLEQEAYGLLKAKDNKKSVKVFSCEFCSKAYVSHYGLKKHLKVHLSIDNYKKGIIAGQKKRKEKYKRKIDTSLEGCSVNNKDDKSKINLIKEEAIKPEDMYKCTCGKKFKRKSCLETCLRSHNIIIESSTSISCVTCTKEFKSEQELVTHRKKLHRKRFPCKFCPTDYNTRKELLKHLQRHQQVQLTEYKVMTEYVKDKKKLHCFICSKQYCELSDLKSHVMVDHKEPYICPICKETFSKIIDFADHTRSFHPEIEGQSVLDVIKAFSKLVKAWKCGECDIQFHEADKLALHQVEKHGPDLRLNPQVQCPDCQRCFVNQKGLTSHRRAHHNTESIEEPIEEEIGVMCLECRKICKDMEALTSHMRLHSPDRKFPCKFCDFRFATPEKRKSHAEIHTGDMKYVCFICEYQCSSENRLKKHKMSEKHLSMQEYLLTGKPLTEVPAPEQEKFKKKKKVSESSSDEKDCMCDICGKKFSDVILMQEHKKTHPFIEFPNDDKPSRIFFK